MSLFRPKGIFSAQWTPVDGEGRLQRRALADHLAFERRAGIDGVLALGSTGEFPRFSVAERKTIIATIAELAAPLPVIANISDIRPQAAIELGRFARELGLPAVTLMPPSFYPVSQPDMLEYFLHVASAVELPVMLYNFPELTGNRIGLETIAGFADRAPLVGIKQSGGEFAYHGPLIALGRARNFSVMTGADTRLPEAFSAGAAGAIGGLVNIVPELMVALERHHRQSGPDSGPAAARMVEVGGIVDRVTFPLNVAAGIEARGFDPGAPKVPVSAASREGCGEVIRELTARFEQWGLARPAPSPG